MADRPLHLALRELRVDFTNPRGLAALAGVGLLLGISGPFETFDLIPTIPRILYWLVVTYVTYGVGTFINMYLQYRLGDQLAPFPIKILVYGTATAIGVMAVLLAINTLAFGWLYKSPQDFAVNFAMIWLVCVIIVALLTALTPLPDAPGTITPKMPALLDRLPLDKRGSLVALSVADHYVQVTTTNGHEMILMRLSDAIKETSPTKGLQVHRSHWVALDQIAKAERVGDRAVLTLHNGSEVPASRSYVPALRDAGVFPKSNRG